MNKKIFKFLSMFLSLIIIASSISGVFAVEKPISSINNTKDYYASQFDKYQDYDETVKYLRKAMVNRENSVTLYYKTSCEISANILNDLFEDALKETFSPVEGDYLTLLLNLNLNSENIDIVENKVGNIYYYDMEFPLQYYTTKKQEDKLTQEIEKVLKSFKFNSKTTDKQKCDAIYKYITSKVKYDYKNLNNDKYTLKFTAYAALINKTAVCQGYAALFYRMAKMSGLDARVIIGTSENQPHAWNIVKLGKYYYYVDATWDAGKKEYDYYLKDSKSFSNHEEDSSFKTKDFTKKYPIFSLTSLLAPKNVKAKLCGYNDIKISWDKVKNADIYRVYYTKTKYKETKSTNVTLSNLSNSTKYALKVVPCVIENGLVYEDDNYKTVYCTTAKDLSAPKKVETVLYGHDDVKVTWSKVSGATHYKVYYKKSTSKNYTYLTTTSSTTVKKSGLSDGVKYYFKVYPCIKVNNEYCEDSSYKYDTIYTLKQISAPKVKKYSKTKVILSWSNISGESGYEISYSTSKSKTGTVIRTTSTSKTITVKKGKTYYYKVRAYKTVNGKRYYAPWSSLKSYKLK